MIARELISETIPPLKSKDTIELAFNFMNEFNVAHFPLIDRSKYLGLVTEDVILDAPDSNKTLSTIKTGLIRPFVRADQHIFEVIKIAAEQKLTLIPVVGEEMEYIGSITLRCLVTNLADVNSVKEPGGIIVLEMPLHDYSLSEISRIVESNDAVVLSSYIHAVDDSKLELTLKLNKADIKHIIATFQRFEYRIKDTYLAENHLDYVKDRYDALMKYLSI